MSDGLATLANPLQGTDSRFDFSNGNTYPAIARPWGMNFWTPQTDTGGWLYQYAAHHLQGIRCTHQPSPWIADYGHFTIMPVVGRIMSGARARASGFRHSEEVAYPHFYRVHLRRYGVTAEVTPTERGAVLRFTYPTTDEAALIFDLFDQPSAFEVDPAQGRITGFSSANNGGVPDGFACFFVAELDADIHGFDAFEDAPGGFVRFAARAERPVTVRIATSFISVEQAQRNLAREIGARGFDQVVAEAAADWNAQLGRIQIDAFDPAHERTFYSALYRALLFPRTWTEYDAHNQPVHRSPYDGRVHAGEMVTDNGFWDTYRTVYPLLALAYPERLSTMLTGWLNTYRESGWLPKWASPGHRDCMIGTHIDAVFADACVKGIPGVDWELAYEAMRKHATTTGVTTGAYGRLGLADYINLGYVPCDRVESAASRTLDFAYNDFCVAQVARTLGHEDECAVFAQRAANYRNVYDAQTGFMRGRLANGAWAEPFDPVEWGGPFVEGSAWQHTWTVPHAVDDLIQLMGGREGFIRKLDAMLAAEPRYAIGSYAYEIHEMTEMAAVDFGQYAHSNQPVHHVLYLYALAGAPSRTQYWVRRVLAELYHSGPDGLCGDEDNGEMGAWYVLSALGFFPVCPGKPELVLGSPLFRTAQVHLSHGNSLTIAAPDNSTQHVYVASWSLNGVSLPGATVQHADLVAGGVLRADMVAQPPV